MSKDKTIIYVNMLGKFSIWNADESQRDSAGAAGSELSLTGRSRKLWTLVAYIIMHRFTGASTQELIELLWPEGDYANPESTLQNTVSRVRTTLKNLGFENAKDLVVYEDGFYRWAPGCELVFDVEQFENACKEALAETDRAKQIEYARQAVALYKGDFLSEASTELWCVNQNAYYRSLFLEVCRCAVDIQMQEENLIDVVDICKRVIALDPSIEEFSIYLMRALIASGSAQKALEHYDNIKELYQSAYGIAPSSELEIERVAAQQALFEDSTSEDELSHLLLDGDQENGAFYCNNVAFREIVNLHLNSLKRSDDDAQILVVKLIGAEESQESRAVYMKQMEQCLHECLRSGDPFTRIGAFQYWALLPGCEERDAAAVFNRIDAVKHKKFPSSKAQFKFKTIDLHKAAQDI